MSLFCTSQSQNRDTFQAYSAEMSCNSESVRRPILKQLEKLDMCSIVARLTNTGVLQLLAKHSATIADLDFLQQLLVEKAWKVSLFCCSQSQNRETFQAFSAEMFCKPASVRRPG